MSERVRPAGHDRRPLCRRFSSRSGAGDVSGWPGERSSRSRSLAGPGRDQETDGARSQSRDGPERRERPAVTAPRMSGRWVMSHPRVTPHIGPALPPPCPFSHRAVGRCGLNMSKICYDWYTLLIISGISLVD